MRRFSPFVNVLLWDAMKISCPGCGKTYEIPQSLIDEIIERHRPRPIKIADANFIPVAKARSWTKGKLAVLIGGAAIPTALAVSTYKQYVGPTMSPTEAFIFCLVAFNMSYGILMVFLGVSWSFVNERRNRR